MDDQMRKRENVIAVGDFCDKCHSMPWGGLILLYGIPIHIPGTEESSDWWATPRYQLDTDWWRN